MFRPKNMNKNPHISVIMPVYNCGNFVAESIESILNQTYSDFEFIIIDDHSTDNTLEILKSYTDERMVIYEKEVNRGMVDSLNFGISKARGCLIARMDGDDISYLTRFEKQVAMLKANPEIDILSANARIIGRDLAYNYSKEPEQVKVDLLFGSAFVHASLLGKIEVFRNNPFDEKMKHAEDYDLWTRLAFTSKMSNMNEVLYSYRRHEGQVSRKYRKTQSNNCNIAQCRMFHHIPYDKQFFPDHLVEKALRKKTSTAQETKKIFLWFKTIKRLNHKRPYFEIERFDKAVKKLRRKFIKYSLHNLKASRNLSINHIFILSKEDFGYFVDVLKNRFVKRFGKPPYRRT